MRGASAVQAKLVRYIAEIVEEMSENIEENGMILESITRKTEIMKFFTL
jgi:archaellum component FlaC